MQGFKSMAVWMIETVNFPGKSRDILSPSELNNGIKQDVQVLICVSLLLISWLFPTFRPNKNP